MAEIQRRGGCGDYSLRQSRDETGRALRCGWVRARLRGAATSLTSLGLLGLLLLLPRLREKTTQQGRTGEGTVLSTLMGLSSDELRPIVVRREVWAGPFLAVGICACPCEEAVLGVFEDGYPGGGFRVLEPLGCFSSGHGRSV